MSTANNMSMQRRDVAAESAEWIEVGMLEDIPRLGSRVLRTAEGDVAVFRTADDQVFALRDRCPHKGGPLSQGIVYDRRVACPLHNWVISLESGEATGPDTGCTKSFTVRIETGRVFVSADVSDDVPVTASCSATA